MKFIDQSANELRLNLVNSEYSEKELSVLTREYFNFNDIKIEYGILGASHFLKLQKNDLIFAEVFACIELELENSSLFVGGMEHRKLEIFNDWLSYNFESQIMEWNQFSKDKYDFFEKNYSSSFLFPLNDKFNFLAKTQVIFKVINDIITLETMHAYPNENKIVFTKTQIKEK